MSGLEERLRAVTRRHFFYQSGGSIGAAALSALLNDRLSAGPREDANPLAPQAPHFAPKASSSIDFVDS